jgi:signal transduction histidine kinase
MKLISMIRIALIYSIILLGLVVIVGWVVTSPMLVQIHSSFVPMQMNTAIGFFMTGSAMLCVLNGWTRVGMVASGLVSLLGVLTLLQYIAGINLGIDQLFIQPVIGVDPVIPGRIGANTALCFSIIGLALLSSFVVELKRCWVGMAGGIVLVMAIASLWGYLSNLPGLSGWGDVLSGMAVHTALGFLVVGLVMYHLPTSSQSKDKSTRDEEYADNPKKTCETLITPATIAIPIIVLSVCVWNAMESWEQSNIDEITTESSQSVARHLERVLDDRFMQLERMASRWEMDDGTHEQSWRADALNFVAGNPGLQAVEWVDTKNIVRWVEPIEGNEKVVGMYGSFDDKRMNAQNASHQERAIRATKTISLVQGGNGFLVYVPVVVDGKHDGFILGVFNVSSFLTHSLEGTTYEHEVLVSENGEEIFSTELEADVELYRADPVSLQIAGVDWKVHLRPTKNLISSHASVWPEAMMFVGTLTAIGIGSLVRILESGRQVRSQLEHLLGEVRPRLEAKNIELERSNAEMEEFTYTVSHDLKSPLVTIDGYLSFLKQDIEAKRYDRLVDFAGRIESATKRMGDTISDLLELSRVGRGSHQVTNVETREVVLEVVSMMEGELTNKNIEVLIPSFLPVIKADRVRTIQIFQNLISNAIRHGQHEDKPCILRIGAKFDGDWVNLYVSDNGPGINPQHHEKVFELFHRINTGVEGTGVGLAIVSRIAQLHGGRAWVESQLGEGATFYVSLPSADQKNITPDLAA